MSAITIVVQIITCSAAIGAVIPASLTNRGRRVATIAMLAGIVLLATIVDEPLAARVVDAAARSLAFG